MGKIITMKTFCFALLAATVSSGMPGMGIGAPTAGPTVIAASAADYTYPVGINADPAMDAAYFNAANGGVSHSTGNYAYSIKPNEYTSWNGISYTHNYDSTGKYGGANRIPAHDYPLLITVLRSNNKPSMLTQRPSTDPEASTPPSQPHALPAGNEHMIPSLGHVKTLI